MIKFITFTQHGDFITEQGQDAYGAAMDLLTHDGHNFDIVLGDDGMYHLFVSSNSANSTFGDRDMAEWYDYSADSEEAVYQNVCEKGGVHDTYAMTVTDYYKMLDEIEA